jgi:hypothetical protein
LERGDPSAWEKLWQELHHQGDVGEAVPELVRVHRMRGVPDWNTYALVATVEEARHSGRNPAVPDWLLPDYEAAWRVLETLALAEFPAADSGEFRALSLCSHLRRAESRWDVCRCSPKTSARKCWMPLAGVEYRIASRLCNVRLWRILL